MPVPVAHGARLQTFRRKKVSLGDLDTPLQTRTRCRTIEQLLRLRPLVLEEHQAELDTGELKPLGQKLGEGLRDMSGHLSAA